MLVATLLGLAGSNVPACAQAQGVAAASPHADDPADVERRLPTLHGVARARALAQLVDAHKLDDARRALSFGNEALRQLASSPDDTARVTTLNEMGWAAMSLGRYADAERYLNDGLQLAGRTSNELGEARALSNLGTLAQRRGQPQRAIVLFSRALALQKRAGNAHQVANSLNNLGFVTGTDLADYSRALAFHLEALDVREGERDSSGIALSLNNIGIVYARLRQYDRALRYFERALVIRRSLGFAAREAATLSNIGDAWLDSGEPARALGPQREALAIRERLDDPSAVALSHRNIGVVLLALGQADSARVELVQSLEIARATGDRGLLARALLSSSEAARAGSRTADALRDATEGLSIARAMGSRELVRLGLQQLSAAQQARGNATAALASYQAFKALSDSIYDETTARHTVSLEQRFAEERRQRELERVWREEAESELALHRRTVQRDLVLGAALLLIIIGANAFRRRQGRVRVAEELSMTDSLTGARNRRYVRQRLADDVPASLRRHHRAFRLGGAPTDGDLAFFLLDLDHFKLVNDRYGHAAGDRLLADLAGVLRSAVGEDDVVARWGGEEFLVLVRFTDRTLVPDIAERMRATVEAHTTVLDGGASVGVTCSIGFGIFPAIPADPNALGWEGVVSLADHGTYAAKRMGRNAWVGFGARDGRLPDGILHASPTQVERWAAEGLLEQVTSDAVLTA